MTDVDTRAEDLHRALRRVHWSVLAMLATCALVIMGLADPADDAGVGGVDRRFTALALLLGIGSIVSRWQAWSPRSPVRTRWVFAVVGMLLASGIGLVAVALARVHDEREAALLYVLGAAILALRPPPPMAAEGSPR